MNESSDMETYFSNMTAEEGTKEKLGHDLMTLVRDAEELVRVTGTQLAGKSKVELNTALERLKTGCRKVEQKAVVGARHTDRAIRRHPYQSIGLAFGVGLLVGALLNRE